MLQKVRRGVADVATSRKRVELQVTQLLCSLATFHDAELRPLALVYLYKRGSWYPFVPVGTDRRDNAQELQIKSVVGADLNFESDLSRWFPIYGAPGL